VRYLELTLAILNCIEETLVKKSFRNSSGRSHGNVRPSTNELIGNFASNKKKSALHCATPQKFEQDLLWFRINVNMARYI